MGSWTQSKKDANSGKDEKKDMTQKMISDFQFKIGRADEEDNYEEIYMKLDYVEKQDKLREDFDFLDEKSHDQDMERQENYEEHSFAQLKQGEDVLDVGDGYGEMEQGIEDEDDSGYQGFEE
jgi:hypothetical protein